MRLLVPLQDARVGVRLVALIAAVRPLARVCVHVQLQCGQRHEARVAPLAEDGLGAVVHHLVLAPGVGAGEQQRTARATQQSRHGASLAGRTRRHRLHIVHGLLLNLQLRRRAQTCGTQHRQPTVSVSAAPPTRGFQRHLRPPAQACFLSMFVSKFNIL